MEKFIFKGVLLDFDNTLYDYNLSHKAAEFAVIDYVSRKFGVSHLAVETALNQARFKIKEKLSGTAAAHNRLLYFQNMLEILSINALKESLNLYNIYWDTFFEHMILYPEAFSFLDHINKKYKTCLVTDLTAHIQYRKIHKLGISDLINFIVTSEEVGNDKPHGAMFNKALEKLNLNTDEVCMIGDNFQKDILGAMSHGIKSFWLTSNTEKGLLSDQSKFNDLVMPFSSFKELLEYLP